MPSNPASAGFYDAIYRYKQMNHLITTTIAQRHLVVFIKPLNWNNSKLIELRKHFFYNSQKGTEQLLESSDILISLTNNSDCSIGSSFNNTIH